MFSSNEYILADKAYQIDKHIITPYKIPIAYQKPYRDFNLIRARHRIKIEHPFGVLEALASGILAQNEANNFKR